jgi:hypothetical protein
MVTNVTEGAKKKVANTQAAVEADLLYPLLRGRDVMRWGAAPSIQILMVQDPDTRRGIAIETMEKKFPKAHSYLAKFEKILKTRAAFRRYFRDTDPYWSMFNISPFTFSPWKVVWREQASTFTAAVVGPHEKRPVIPDHKLMMVAVDSRTEAHYLCCALNSAPSCLAVAAYAIQIQMDMHILENVGVPQFSKSNKTHLRLAELSEGAHKAAAKGETAEVKKIEEEIDREAARLWRLSDEHLAEIKRSLEES